MNQVSVVAKDGRVTVKDDFAQYGLLTLPVRATEKTWVSAAVARVDDTQPCLCTLILDAGEVLAVYTALGDQV